MFKYAIFKGNLVQILETGTAKVRDYPQGEQYTSVVFMVSPVSDCTGDEMTTAHWVKCSDVTIIVTSHIYQKSEWFLGVTNGIFK